MSFRKNIGLSLRFSPAYKRTLLFSDGNYILEGSINLEKGVFMTANGKVPLNSRIITAIKPSKVIFANIGENRGFRVTCGNAETKTVFYRIHSPVNDKLVPVKMGDFQSIFSAKARFQLQELKEFTKFGRYPVTIGT